MAQNLRQNVAKARSGVVWDGSWSLSGLLGRVLEHLGGVSRRLGRVLGVLGVFWAASSGVLGLSWRGYRRLLERVKAS